MLTLKNSILRSLLVIAGSLLFVWIAWTVLIPGDGNKFIAWGCFCFFFATFFNGVYHLVDRRAKILIDANGIYFPGQQRSIIDWSEIKEFEIERNQYQDIIWIELQEGEPLHLKMFYLNISPEELHRQVKKFMKRAEGLPDADELRRMAGKKSLAEFVEPDKTAAASDFTPSLAVETDEDDEKDENENCVSSDKSADLVDLSRKNNAKYVESEKSDSGCAETDPEDTEKPADSYLTSPWLFPPWFSNDGVTNDIIWTACISGGGTAFLFIFAHFDDMGPPKISVAEQLLIVIAAGILGPILLYLSSFLKNGATYRSWSGKSSKDSVSYSVKAKKRATAHKADNSGEAPRKARSKKHRR